MSISFVLSELVSEPPSALTGRVSDGMIVEPPTRVSYPTEDGPLFADSYATVGTSQGCSTSYARNASSPALPDSYTGTSPPDFDMSGLGSV